MPCPFCGLYEGTLCGTLESQDYTRADNALVALLSQVGDGATV